MFEVQLVALPLFHSFGASAQMNAGFSVGSGPSCLLQRFDAHQALSLMNEEGSHSVCRRPDDVLGLLEALDDSGRGAWGVADRVGSGRRRVPAAGGLARSSGGRFDVTIVEG